MKVRPGFDKRNAGVYRWILCGFVLASALMLMVALLGKSAVTSPGKLHALIWPGLACAVAAWSYIATQSNKLSFRYVGIAGFAFSLAMYGFGMPMRLVILVGLISFLGTVVSVALGEKADKQVEDDDLGA